MTQAFVPLKDALILRRGILVRVGGTFAVLGAAVALSRNAPPARDVGALAVALGEAAGGGVVQPDDLRWEQPGSLLEDVACGRSALFLASAERGGPRDVWRARVRLTPEGRPIEVLDAHNLTSTPLGDDHSLVLEGLHAAFATTSYGQEQSVTLLDLSGEGDQNKTQTVSDRLMSAITNVQQTGSAKGIARVDVTLEKPARYVGLALSETALAIDMSDARHAVLDLSSGELTGGVDGLHAEAAMHLPKRFSHWAVDTARAVPWIGPAPIAWLEDTVFALRDDAKQFAFKVRGGSSSDVLSSNAVPPPPLLDTSQASLDAGHWPPAGIPSIWQTPEPGEGEWASASPAWLRKVPSTDASSPPPFLRTFVRPDEERPYAKVLLVAMDTRQLDFEMEAGVEDPQPLTGPHGAGRLPRDAATYRRVVAAFNGAFKTEHGHYGMMVHRRILLPPVPGAASVVTLKDGRVGLGTWGVNKALGTPSVPGQAIAGVTDDEIISFRQNLDPLLDHGQVNPSGRALWGYTLPGKGVQTERSGLCVTTAGHLVYAWGDDVSATTLGKAMRMAGCDYGLHLDMNPYHTGFMFTNIEDIDKKRYKSELLSTGMEIASDRYIQYAPKDFFYVLLHDPTPAAMAGSGSERGVAWSIDPGTQPAPAWMPGIWRARLDAREGEVDLLDIEKGRASWRVRAGAMEAPAAAPARELSAEDAARVLLAVGLGVAPEKRQRGLATDGRLIVPVRGGDGWGVLLAQAETPLAILRARDAGAPPEHGDLIELPLVLDEGAVTEAPAGTTTMRAALGTAPDGRVLLARGTFSNHAPLARALARAGCTRAVALDRGEHVEGFLHRAGLAAAPRARYDESVLYTVAVPMKTRGFHFEPQVAAPPLVPRGGR